MLGDAWTTAYGRVHADSNGNYPRLRPITRGRPRRPRPTSRAHLRTNFRRKSDTLSVASTAKRSAKPCPDPIDRAESCTAHGWDSRSLQRKLDIRMIRAGTGRTDLITRCVATLKATAGPRAAVNPHPHQVETDLRLGVVQGTRERGPRSGALQCNDGSKDPSGTTMTSQLTDRNI